MSEDNGWQHHRGRSCPVPPETKVQVRYRNGEVSDTFMARERRWEAWPRDMGETDWDIIAWRPISTS
jgi:hypothetical protein